MAKNRRKKTSLGKLSGKRLEGLSLGKVKEYGSSVLRYAKSSIKSLERGLPSKKLSSKTTKANITYREIKSWIKQYEKAVADNDRDLINKLVKSGGKLINRKTSTASNIYKMTMEQDKKHPSTKGLDLNQRAFIYSNTGQIFGTFTSNQIDRYGGSDRIIQVMQMYMEDGLSGPDLIDAVIDDINSVLDALDEIDNYDDLEPGTYFNMGGNF